MTNALEQLKTMTVVVADTGDFNTMKAFRPRDATTNPTLIVKAIQKSDYANLLKETVATHRGVSAEEMTDRLLVHFGTEILKIIPGRVSTEVDARLSYDTQASIARAKRIIGFYDKAGIGTDRVLIKLASTWEGIRAAEQLEREGIHCNLTLLFGFAQAVACADAGVTLISPFVGRIYDWYKKKENTEFTAENDPGVHSVQRIYAYYKKFGYKTEVMGASFRNVGQILALAGCDLLTISPDLLKQLAESNDTIARRLDPKAAPDPKTERVTIDEKAFRFELNQDAMAYEKLAEGIRGFTADALIADKLIADGQLG